MESGRLHWFRFRVQAGGSGGHARTHLGRGGDDVVGQVLGHPALEHLGVEACVVMMIEGERTRESVSLSNPIKDHHPNQPAN